MVVATIKYVDPTPLQNGARHWSKVEGPFQSFALQSHQRTIEDISGREADFDIDAYGVYYSEVERVLRAKLPVDIEKVVIFDHTLRRMEEGAARKPVMQVHVDQTARAAEERVRRHVDAGEAEELLKLRHALINVWRPITPAIEYPLAVVDWRSTTAEDYVEVDLLYPTNNKSEYEGDLEMAPEKATLSSTEGYEVRGETYGVAPNDSHRFLYVKNMQPDWTMFIKCNDSKGPGLPNGVDGVASCCPHTAFVDPETPVNAPLRRSIEVRCLVFFK